MNRERRHSCTRRIKQKKYWKIIMTYLQIFIMYWCLGKSILKRYHGQNFAICSLGSENQSTIDKYMPIRIMGYDFAAYQEMVKNKKEIVPTISIVLNFSDTRWNQATSLHGMMQLLEELKELVPDYHFRVYDVAFLEDDVIDRFTSDFKVVAMFFKKKRLGELDSLGAVGYEIKHIEEVIEVFSVFSQDQRYIEQAEDIIRYQQEGGKVSMCTFVDKFEKRGIEIGMARGISQGISQGIMQGRLGLLKKLVTNGIITLEDAAAEMEVSVSKIEDMFDEMDVSVERT